MEYTGSAAKAWLTLTKPGVVVLLQITALCAVLSHDLLEASGFSDMDWNESIRTMAIVFVGGYLTAGVLMQSICGTIEILIRLCNGPQKGRYQQVLLVQMEH